MKKAAAIMLLLIMTFQTGYAAAFTVWFHLNRARLAEAYCVNKSRPQLHCDGQCYLAQKIKAAEAKQERAAGEGIVNLWVEWVPAICQTSTSPLPKRQERSIPVSHPHHILGDYSFLWHTSIFRPPAVA